MDASSSGTAEQHADGRGHALARPRLRGVFHLYAFFVALALGSLLVSFAPGGRAQAAAAVFAAAVALMFGASALHHRIAWQERGYRWSRRIDHAGIYLLIAGTYTPFALLVLDGAWRSSILAVVWSGALAAIMFKFALGGRPEVAGSDARDRARLGGRGRLPAADRGRRLERHRALVLAGGLLYTAGGVVYALRRPEPVSRAVFGYHEIFHVLVVAAVGLQYAVVAFWVVHPV